MPPRKKTVTKPTNKNPKPEALPTPTPLPEQADYRVRVRMYRQGLGDCFLITFPRKDRPPFNILIDCGALNRDKAFMTKLVRHIEESVKCSRQRGRLDLVVATHEHKDHLSGFNLAREIFNVMDIGAVWLAWTEDLSREEAKVLKKAKKTAIANLQAALASPFGTRRTLENVRNLLNFSSSEDTTDSASVADALEYLKLRGRDAGTLKFLNPGDGPLSLDGVEDLRVYVLGPPRDPASLKTSGVTEKLKRDGVVYYLGAAGLEGIDGLNAALRSADPSAAAPADDRHHPFAAEHRITRQGRWFGHIKPYVEATYDAPGQEWRKIDEDWLGAFGQLALDLDNDTNNTSLVLAFEFVKTGEVLLFVGDAQVGNWASWARVTFKGPDASHPLPAYDLLKRTVFYKVGHHCSHNATLKAGGLELMESPSLVAFIPLDKATAKAQGRRDEHGKPKGWDMPAKVLYQRLCEKAANRVVLSDVNEAVPSAAIAAGIKADQSLTYVDYKLV
jgi:hypothetical protein